MSFDGSARGNSDHPTGRRGLNRGAGVTLRAQIATAWAAFPGSQKWRIATGFRRVSVSWRFWGVRRHRHRRSIGDYLQPVFLTSEIRQLLFGGNFLRNSAHLRLSARLAVKKSFLALNVPELPGFGAGRLEKWREICVGWSSKRPGSERFRINDDHPKRPQM